MSRIRRHAVDHDHTSSQALEWVPSCGAFMHAKSSYRRGAKNQSRVESSHPPRVVRVLALLHAGVGNGQPHAAQLKYS